MKMIQVRHVPDDVHRTLKSRAALAGMSLSDYVLAELRRLAEQPTMDDVLARLAERTRPPLPVSAADVIRHERDRR
jgi:plasmid stability protein